MPSIIREARERFPVGTYFYSAGNYSLPCVVCTPVVWSEHYPVIKSGGMGIIYHAETKKWATIITKEEAEQEEKSPLKYSRSSPVHSNVTEVFTKNMVALVSFQYDSRTNSVLLQFTRGQKAVFHNSNSTMYTEATALLEKSSLNEIKSKLLKEGMDTDLQEFLGKEFASKHNDVFK